MTDDEPEQLDLGFGPLGEDETKQVAVLTVNQLVAYNLMRARRRMGWTQQETAERLTDRTSKKWTAATLSAAERSWQTGRSRHFDANELAAFAAIFACPIASFFIPIKPGEAQEIWYALSRVDEALPFPIVKSKELLDLAVPLRYPNTLIDEVGALRKLEGFLWSPHARVERYDPAEEGYENWLAEQEGYSNADDGSAKGSVVVTEDAGGNRAAIKVTLTTDGQGKTVEVTQAEFAEIVRQALLQVTHGVIQNLRDEASEGSGNSNEGDNEQRSLPRFKEGR